MGNKGIVIGGRAKERVEFGINSSSTSGGVREVCNEMSEV